MIGLEVHQLNNNSQTSSLVTVYHKLAGVVRERVAEPLLELHLYLQQGQKRL